MNPTHVMPILYSQQNSSLSSLSSLETPEDSHNTYYNLIDDNDQDQEQDSLTNQLPPAVATTSPTDADDTIFLSDLVRSGEASRLRRRGAMRLDHTSNSSSAHNDEPTSTTPLPPPDLFRFSNSLRTTTWEAEMDLIGGSSSAVNNGNDTEGDYEDFAEGVSAMAARMSIPTSSPSGPIYTPMYPITSLPPREERRQQQRTSRSSRSDQRVYAPTNSVAAATAMEADTDESRYTLICGAEISDSEDLLFAATTASASATPYEPSPLPAASSSTVRKERKRITTTSGCGALIHARAAPRQKLGVWTAKTDASSVVIGMDSSYFDRAAVVKMVRSPCGCVREGVGCAVCGNPLGTRYKPCKTAGDGIFNGRPKPPSGPLHAKGSRQHSHSNFYVYTFFASAVTSYPEYSFPTRPHAGGGDAQQPQRLSTSSGALVSGSSSVESLPSPTTPTMFGMTAFGNRSSGGRPLPRSTRTTPSVHNITRYITSPSLGTTTMNVGGGAAGFGDGEYVVEERRRSMSPPYRSPIVQPIPWNTTSSDGGVGLQQRASGGLRRATMTATTGMGTGMVEQGGVEEAPVTTTTTRGVMSRSSSSGSSSGSSESSTWLRRPQSLPGQQQRRSSDGRSGRDGDGDVGVMGRRYRSDFYDGEVDRDGGAQTYRFDFSDAAVGFDNRVGGSTNSFTSRGSSRYIGRDADIGGGGGGGGENFSMVDENGMLVDMDGMVVVPGSPEKRMEATLFPER